MSEQWVVLIIDDSDDDRADVRRDLLRGADREYRFLEATTGAAALSLWQSLAPDAPTCVVLDYYLPDMDAPHLLKALRGARELPVCPIVLLTGSGERDVWRNALRAGAMDCLGKAWMNPESLTRAVENAVERHALLGRRAEAEARLRETDARLRLAMDAADAGMWDWDVATGAVNWSPGCYPIFGLADGDFAGTATAFDRLVHPDDRDRVWQAVRRAVTQRTKYEADFRVVRPDGRVRWVANVGRALYDDGGPVRMLGMVTDITTRKLAEHDARERDDRLRYVMRASGVGTWSIDLAGGTMECSDECRRIFGVPAGEPFTTLDQRLARIHPDDRDAQAAAMVDAVGEGREYQAEYRIVWPNGDIRWVLGRGRGVPDDTRSPWRITGITLDITERKAAEALARDASRQKDEFVAIVAHELRGPLSPVRTAAALLTRVSPPESDGARYAGVIGRQVAHMARMLDDLLDITRLSQGKLTLRRQALTLRAVIDSAVEVSRPDIERRGHHLELEDPGESIQLEGDPGRLTQVFSNLLHNAAKYTSGGGRISIVTERDPQGVTVSVRDTGIGIAPEMLPHVFDMFVQADMAKKHDGGGLGIGLAITRRLVELHQGRVEARSGGAGLGSEFRVYLPVTPVPRAALDDRQQAENGHSKYPGRRVLVADDDRDGADMLALLLEQTGCAVCAVYDGESAVREAERFQPEVAFIDLGMPGVSGHDAARRVRAAPWGAGMVLIALTGRGQKEDRRASAAAGFDAHVVKPVDPRTLGDVMAGVQLRQEQ